MWPSGDFYEGDYIEGLKHGYGKCMIRGETFEGIFHQDQMVEGEYQWKDGRRYKGQFRDQKMNG